uniref:Uncharacterized protein n=1 Tax=Cucumis sativus TaxID=3659 RepID=A0A0A0K3D6_CUCSA
MAFKTNTVASASSAVAISSEVKLLSSLFTHSPAVLSSNPQISSANNPKSLHASPERISFQHGIPMFLHKCKTGSISVTQAHQFFDLMMRSIFSFNRLLAGLAKIEHYSQVSRPWRGL